MIPEIFKVFSDKLKSRTDMSEESINSLFNNTQMTLVRDILIKNGIISQEEYEHLLKERSTAIIDQIEKNTFQKRK